MNKSIATVLLSATCMLGLTGCGGLIKVQRAVEAKGYDVEKVGVVSSSSGRVLTVYTEDALSSSQKQEVIQTAEETYRKKATVVVKKGSDRPPPPPHNKGGAKPNGGARPNQ
ncbi:hypothetical protein G6O69_13900 [Pseudenhygromyxa sp. WMMC2535]|uniref:hypothetical protein n=1 Tax=Pseudenhygromyxa sp. WMMC2535 TaxID=2712867 RepID=UPI001552CAB2|nr:hypothetical protein [Pseudenhygromyxa sp. WMMC2535]NVB38930.1 hypothetical protein [Pseudenhygromyxa sp. WMMC2535]